MPSSSTISLGFAEQKFRNVMTDDDLTSKADAFEASVAKCAPQKFLRFSRVSTQRSRAENHYAAVGRFLCIHNDRECRYI